MLEVSEFTDYYKLLEIKPSADTIQIRRAFIQKAKQSHPDVGGSTESMRLLNTAYKTLTTTTLKTAYDFLHRFHTGKKEIEYKKVGIRTKTKSSPTTLSDEYIDWFIDSIYAEYNNTNKSKLNLGKLVKKVFRT